MRSLFVSYVFEDSRHRDDVVKWAKEGRLGDFVAIFESQDMREKGEPAIRAHLRDRIRGSAVVLGLIGKDTHNHRWVRYELAVATSFNKKVLLAQIPGTEGAAPKDFRHFNRIPLNPERLKKDLEAIMKA